MSATTASSDRHRIDRMAMALCRVAYAADVALPIAHARRVAATVENVQSSACRDSAAGS
jgi:hypothetical protein